MPRKIKATARQVQIARRDWWAFHYEQRQRAKQLTSDQAFAYQYIASAIKQPEMTVFGGVHDTYPERLAYEMCGKQGLDVNLVNPWYLTDEGWSQFQDLWNQLPEPVDLYTPPCVQIGELYTLSTMPAESEPPK